MNMLADIRAYDEAKRTNGESFPAELVYAILDGANPIKVYREYRQLTQRQLAEKVGISVPYLSELESGKKPGSLQVLQAVAAALGKEIEVFLPRS